MRRVRRLLRSGKSRWSREPAGRDVPGGFVVVGDFGTGDEAEGAVASGIRAWISTLP